jgi:hypothetical protein
MPVFRAALADGDIRPITADVVRELCADVTRTANIFAAPPRGVAWQRHASEELFWEVYRGQLLDGTRTRQRRQLETWGIHLVDERGERSTEPILAVRFDTGEGRLYVTRSILSHIHEPYESGGNVILTREAQKWQPELVGTITIDRIGDAGALRDELACLLFHAVVGTSRLPLTSIEAPLPGYALGQFGYFYRPATPEAGPLTSWSTLCRLPKDVALCAAERVKQLELALRATPADALDALVGQYPASAGETLPLLRAVFNAVTLSPFTDFTAKALQFVRCLERHEAIRDADRADLLCHLIRQLARHLAAYDLVTFHHRGANYPDALLLEELLADLLPVAAEKPHLFVGEEREPRLRRRAIRHGLLLQLEYAGHSVPDSPTSPGENLRVLPEPFRRVPDDQIYSPVTRHRQLFGGEHRPDAHMAITCFNDLEQPKELQELGTALFLERPLGFAKAAGEPDQTLLASHVMFSRTLAEQRLEVLARRPDWLPDAGAIERWRRQLADLVVDGLPLRNAGPPPRPGVVSLHDALRVADDWIMVRTTSQTLREFQEQYDIRALLEQLGGTGLPLSEWRLLIPGGTEARPTLCAYDQQLRLRLDLAADMSRGYATRGGFEFPAADLRRAGSESDRTS